MIIFMRALDKTYQHAPKLKGKYYIAYQSHGSNEFDFLSTAIITVSQI